MSKRRQIITAGGPKLQAPTLPVEVTSGKLGPEAAYDAKNWGGTIVWGTANTGDTSGVNRIYGANESAGDYFLLSMAYSDTDYLASPTFVSEANVNRIFYDYVTGLGLTDAEASFIGMWKLTSAFASASDVEVQIGDNTSYNSHNYGATVVRNLSEYY